jgi:hypothetical protein
MRHSLISFLAFGIRFALPGVPSGTQQFNLVKGVYLADGALRIFDVTNPGNPVKLGEYISPTGNGIQNIAIQGNYIYLGDGSYGFRILDITNPASPQLVSSTSLTNTPWGVTVSSR